MTIALVQLTQAAMWIYYNKVQCTDGFYSY